MQDRRTQPFIPSSCLLVILALWCCAMLWHQEPVVLGGLQDAVDCRSSLEGPDVQLSSELFLSASRQQVLAQPENASTSLSKALFFALSPSSPSPQMCFVTLLAAKLFSPPRPDMWSGFVFCSRSPPFLAV